MRCLEESLCRYLGQTVTIFTTSGGLSGSGFTGVLAHVGNGCVKLITCIGAAPACAVGSECSGWGHCGRRPERKHVCTCGGRCTGRCEKIDIMPFDHGRNFLGSVTEIPIDRIASFTHNAI